MSHLPKVAHYFAVGSSARRTSWFVSSWIQPFTSFELSCFSTTPTTSTLNEGRRLPEVVDAQPD